MLGLSGGVVREFPR